MKFYLLAVILVFPFMACKKKGVTPLGKYQEAQQAAVETGKKTENAIASLTAYNKCVVDATDDNALNECEKLKPQPKP